MYKDQGGRQNDERLGLSMLGDLKCAPKLLSATKRKRFGFDLRGMRRAFHRAELRTRDLSIPHDRESLIAWDGLDQKLYLLGAELRNVEEEAGDVPAWPRQRFDPAGPNGIGLE